MSQPDPRRPRLPEGGWVPQRPRIGLSREAARGVVLAVVPLLLVGGVFAWRARPEPVAGSALSVAGVAVVVPSARGASPSASGALAPPSGPAATVVVQVVGGVRHPGVLHLGDGARVVDAVAAAGGAVPGARLGCLNLARRLVDGEQIVVGGAPSARCTPAAAQAGGAAGPTPGAAAAGAATVDLNTATLEQLDALPGVGPVLAQRILDWRTAHGRFATVDDLRDVAGVGDKKFADLTPHVRV